MRPRLMCFAVALLLPTALGILPPARSASPPPAPRSLGVSALDGKGRPLPFSRFFRPGPREMQAVPELRAYSDRRVRVVGFMAAMEAPVTGSFYLVPVPLESDEEGGGTADLPPAAVRVLVRGAKGKVIAHQKGLISATGKIHVGPTTTPDGIVSFLTLTLDRPEDLVDSPAKAASKPPLKSSLSLTSPSKKESTPHVQRPSAPADRGRARSADRRRGDRRP